MNISELSIRRPVLSTVLTLIILLFGFIGYNYLGVREYPSVANLFMLYKKEEPPRSLIYEKKEQSPPTLLLAIFFP